MTECEDKSKIIRPEERPKVICKICKEFVGLQFRNNTEPYLQHDNLISTCNGGNAISDFASSYLYYLLQQAFVFIIQGKCSNCNKKWRINISEIPCRLEQNYILPTEKNETIIDLVGINSDNTINYGIIFHKPNLPSLQGLNFPCYLICPNYFLNRLDRVEMPTEIKIREESKTQLCSIYCIPIEEMAVILGYVKKIPSYPCEAVKIIDKALNGKYSSNIEEWNLTGSRVFPEPDIIKGIWDKFLRLKKCIKCHINDDFIAYRKPYCGRCYNSVLSGYGLINERTEVTSKEVKEIKRNLFWMSKIPKRDKTTDPCFYCNKTYLSRQENEGYEDFFDYRTGTVLSYIYWANCKRSCCTVCLDDQFRKRGLVI